MISDPDDDLCSYSEGDDDGLYDDEADDPNSHEDEYGLSESMDEPPEQYYSVLTESEIGKLQAADITEVSNVLSIPKHEAIVLLCYFNWTFCDVLDNWYADEDQVRKSVGLMHEEEGDLILKQKRDCNLTCEICFCFRSGPDRYAQFVSAGCVHLYCRDCYSDYIRVSIDDGIGCLLLRCPDPSCRAVVTQDLINSLKQLPVESKSKYQKFLLRSYVEECREKIKWCPGPGCSNAVEFLVAEENRKHCDVLCSCSHEFCWRCTREAHRPVDCSMVLEWEKKNSGESENVNWILAYTKPCPKCRNPIQKSIGCDHMTCRAPCRHEFCWLCGGNWKAHSSTSCNAYKVDKNNEDKRTKMANMMVDRYAHYFERWSGNERSRKIAENDLEKFRAVNGDILFDNYTPQPVDGIEEAWIQIIECRRVLRWSYVYGYYLPEDGKAKKKFFEYVQGQVESALGRLHECAEQEVKQFIGENPADLDKFIKYRAKLSDLTKVTRKFFENLVSGLQNGLEVDVVDSTLSSKVKDLSFDYHLGKS